MNITKKIGKFKNMPLKLILEKAAKKLYKEVYYSYKRVKIENNPIILESSLFYSFTSKCNFLYNIDKKEYYASELRRLLETDLIIKSADKICNHKFNLLGSGNKCLKEKLSWNEDFKTGFRWKNKFYKDIKIVDLLNNADVKVPWEFSRFQHIFTLGEAYWLTDCEKYTFEFKSEIEDWVEKNPVNMSVNWTCTMDVAIRSVNLICGYFFFKKSAIIDDKFWTQFNISLYLHGRFIYKNLENESQHNGNHYVSDLAGLIWIGIYFGDFSIKDNEKKNNPKDWLIFGISEFEREMDKEVNEDGTDYEASTAYHRLVTELFIITTILCNRNGINFSIKYMQKLEKMCEFIMDITKPNGLSPLIGDADDGRLIIPSNYYNWNKRDFRHILAVAGEYFNRDDFKSMGNDYEEDALWIVGNYKYENKEIHLKSKSYPNGGYYILRNDRIYCIVRCGELSCRGEGGHSHNDQLSFEFNVDGEDFILDPGTYVYTADYKMRNIFRSTKMHNTLYIDGYEQNDFDNYDLFYMKEQSFAKCKLFNNNTFFGEHYGYKEKCSVIHERSINLQNNRLIIKDKLKTSEINNRIYVNFILDYGVEIEERDNGVELTKNSKKVFIEINNGYSIEDSFVSYGYGQKLYAKKLVVEVKEKECEIKIKCY